MHENVEKSAPWTRSRGSPARRRHEREGFQPGLPKHETGSNRFSHENVLRLSRKRNSRRLNRSWRSTSVDQSSGGGEAKQHGQLHEKNIERGQVKTTRQVAIIIHKLVRDPNKNPDIHTWSVQRHR